MSTVELWTMMTGTCCHFYKLYKEINTNRHTGNQYILKAITSLHKYTMKVDGTANLKQLNNRTDQILVTFYC